MPGPDVSVVIPTHNNRAVLNCCLESWRVRARGSYELVVVEDGCRDGTRELLRTAAGTVWGRRHLRWCAETDVHELRATNRGFQEARGGLLIAWQDDMLLASGRLLDELVRTFGAYAELGLIGLSRGLDCAPLDAPIQSNADLVDWRRLKSTIGPRPWNWIRIQEVDSVIRPWAVRRRVLEQIGPLDEAFVPTEWDEADFAFRARQAGWKIATHGFERLGHYRHLGSTTLGQTRSGEYERRVLANGRLFFRRWGELIDREYDRPRRTWPRVCGLAGWLAMLAPLVRTTLRSARVWTTRMSR